MTYNVLMRTLNPTHSLTYRLVYNDQIWPGDTWRGACIGGQLRLYSVGLTQASPTILGPDMHAHGLRNSNNSVRADQRRGEENFYLQGQPPEIFVTRCLTGVC